MNDINKDIKLLCVYILESEEENYNESEDKENHVFALAKKIMINLMDT
ncbi:hypothetical protein GW796_01015 [archaeon]|nr:hypothetical protein [archaeon]